MKMPTSVGIFIFISREKICEVKVESHVGKLCNTYIINFTRKKNGQKNEKCARIKLFVLLC